MSEPMQPADVDLRYYRMRWTRATARGISALAVIFAAVLILGTAHDAGHLTVFGLVFGIGVAALTTVWCETMVTKAGLIERHDGLVYVNAFGRRFFALDDIERFDHKRVGTIDRVQVVVRGRNLAQPLELVQGQRILWETGETRDITTVLNERLAVLKARAQAADPSQAQTEI